MSSGGDLHDWAVRGWLPFGLFVSDKVRVDSENNKDEQYIWESAAGVSFTVQNDTEMAHWGVKRDTKITQSDFLEGRLKDLEKTLSKFIGFAIEFYVEESKEKEVTDSEEDEDDNRGGR